MPFVAVFQLGVIYVLHRLLWTCGISAFQRGAPANSIAPEEESREIMGEFNPRNTLPRSTTYHGNSTALQGKMKEEQVEGKYAFYPSAYVRTLIGLFLFTYNGMTKALFEFFDCFEVESGVTVVRTYPAVDCDSSKYKRLM